MAKIEKEEKATNVKMPFVLPNRIVHVKPVIWNTGWLNFMGGKSHSAAWRHDNASITLQVPIDGKTGVLKEPLTEDERKYFESDRCPLGFKEGSLLANIYVEDTRNNKVLKSEWTKRSYKVSKASGTIDEDTILDTLYLSNPTDYLKYAILRANIGSFVAPDADHKKANRKYLIYLVDEGDDDIVKATKADRIAEAYAHYATISASQTKLREFLTIAWLEKYTKVKPQKENKLEWLKSEANKLIQLDSGTSYLKLANSNYDAKAFIYKAMEVGAIKLTSGGYMTDTGMPLGANLQNAMMYLANPQNQELYIVINEKIGQGGL